MACAIPGNVRLRSFQRFGPGDWLWITDHALCSGVPGLGGMSAVAGFWSAGRFLSVKLSP